MRRTITLVLSLVVFAAACGDSGSSLCDDVAGSYRSVERGASVEIADGQIAPSFEFLRIRGSEFEYQYSDVVEVGDWSCSGDRLVAMEGRFTADLSIEDGVLLLDQGGFVFARDP